jgi:Glu-tRNA(Gln) amidotransferase subunit E-like FAD-binding protein
MYPDTDSPPQRVTRERVNRLAEGLAEEPWLREERYSAAGVPRDLIHYLIRRGGARLVDLVVAECIADLRRACFFFGERLKGLRRDGLAVDSVSDTAWCDFFLLCGVRPVIWEAWRDLVEWLVTHPGGDIFEEAALAGFGIEPENWRDRVIEIMESVKPDHPVAGDEHVFRFFMGRAMDQFRGRVPATEAAAEIRKHMMTGDEAAIDGAFAAQESQDA